MKEELTALRAAMARAGIDAYVVPTDDFHGSEYVGDYFKCRAYVSGFTGSAGTLAVTAEKAGLWTDGRYFLQAASQLAGSGIELMKMGQPGVPTLSAWLEAQLSGGQVLGFDGRTMTQSAGSELEQAAARAGATVDFSHDLVGEIWQDRPALPTAEMWTLPLQYSGKTRKEKLAAVREAMAKAGAKYHVLSSLDDICWLLNVRGGDVECCPVILSFLILEQDRARLYVDEAKVHPRMQGFLAADGVELLPYLQIFEDVKALSGPVLLDAAKTSYSIVSSIESWTGAPNPTELMKAVKTPEEQENMRQAHIKDGVALVKFMKWLKGNVGTVPMTEISTAEKLESLRRQQDFYMGPSFAPIHGYGPHGAIIHYSATPETDAALAPQGFLLSDTGGHYLEGTTDVTRTYALGPLTREMKHHYTLVLRSHLDLLGAKFKAGTCGATLDMLARAPFWQEGLDYNHGTGHGVGYLLSVHEGPQSIRPSVKAGGATGFRAGMITSDEPGIYLENQYGIRLESLVLCRELETTEYGTFLGFEPLTLCPFDLDAILPEELSSREKALLNDYHKKVYETISPFLCENGKAWLREATREI